MQSHGNVPSSTVAGRKCGAADAKPNDRETIDRPIRGEPSSNHSREISQRDSRPNRKEPPTSRKGNPGWRRELDEAIARTSDELLIDLFQAFQRQLDKTDEVEIIRHKRIQFGDERLCATDLCCLSPGQTILPAAMNMFTQLPARHRRSGICALSKQEMINLCEKANKLRADLPDPGVFTAQPHGEGSWEVRVRQSTCVIGPIYVDGYQWVVLEA